MLKRSFLTQRIEPMPHCHDGEGVLGHVGLFGPRELSSGLRFLNYTVLPPGTSIGEHAHGNDEEVYIILEGGGEMRVNGESQPVCAGDAVVNPPYGTHSLRNTGGAEMRILVFEAGPKGPEEQP